MNPAPSCFFLLSSSFLLLPLFFILLPFAFYSPLPFLLAACMFSCFALLFCYCCRCVFIRCCLLPKANCLIYGLTFATHLQTPLSLSLWLAPCRHRSLECTTCCQLAGPMLWEYYLTALPAQLARTMGQKNHKGQSASLPASLPRCLKCWECFKRIK